MRIWSVSARSPYAAEHETPEASVVYKSTVGRGDGTRRPSFLDQKTAFADPCDGAKDAAVHDLPLRPVQTNRRTTIPPLKARALPPW